MSSELARFLVYNLLTSLVAGLIAWGFVLGALRILRARSAFLHSSFLALPMVKSLLMLFGVGWVFPWPAGLSRSLSHLAIPTRDVWLFVLLWFALSLTVYYLLAWREHANMVRGARAPGGDDAPRLAAALDRVVNAYRESPCCQTAEMICCISDQIPEHPLLLVSDGLRSPVALTKGGTPTIIFPGGLVPQLDDDELALALAHELNHFALRKPVLRASGLVWAMMLASPIAFLLADYLHREEEKACDDLAVMALGQADVYAGMLLKSYQFSRRSQDARPFHILPLQPQLLGKKAFLSKRIERLLEAEPPEMRWQLIPWVPGLIWVMLLYVLFFAQFAS